MEFKPLTPVFVCQVPLVNRGILQVLQVPQFYAVALQALVYGDIEMRNALCDWENSS
jgi:hypothetical protein